MAFPIHQMTPTIPNLYWNQESHEQRIKDICMNLERLRAFTEALSLTTNEHSSWIEELEAMIEDEQLTPILEEKVEAFLQEHLEDFEGAIAAIEAQMVLDEADIDALETAADSLDTRLDTVEGNKYKSTQPATVWVGDNDKYPTLAAVEAHSESLANKVSANGAWVSDATKYPSTQAADQRFEQLTNKLTSSDEWASSNTKFPTTGAADGRFEKSSNKLLSTDEWAASNSRYPSTAAVDNRINNRIIVGRCGQNNGTDTSTLATDITAYNLSGVTIEGGSSHSFVASLSDVPWYSDLPDSRKNKHVAVQATIRQVSSDGTPTSYENRALSLINYINAYNQLVFLVRNTSESSATNVVVDFTISSI